MPEGKKLLKMMYTDPMMLATALAFLLKESESKAAC
jgi:hypothetical protein